MLKKILTLNGTQQLTKSEQQIINGGGTLCLTTIKGCPDGKCLRPSDCVCVHGEAHPDTGMCINIS